MATAKPESVTAYIQSFENKEVRNILQKVREVIQKTAPDAVEGISYGIPAYKLNGKILVYFAGFKKHISLYPVKGDEPVGDERFARYNTSGKGTIQFPLNEEVPYDLIGIIVRGKAEGKW